MELEYFDLLSPEPLLIPGVGRLKPPTLRDIARLTYPVYETYLAFLTMTPEHYCTKINPKLSTWFTSLPEDHRSLLSMYDIAVSNEELTGLYSSILRFFFNEDITYDREHDAFALSSGFITKSSFLQITDIILQMNHIRTDQQIDVSKVKNKQGKKIYERIQKLKQQQQKKTTRKNPDLEIGNIISAICIRHKSLNYTNIWDLTIYHLWDTFQRLQTDNAYEINRMAVSVWGDKEKKFDFNGWFTRPPVRFS